MLKERRRWWSSADAEIFRLAVPALGALAAEPLYVLVDTAIIGHIGAGPLAGLALAGTLLQTVMALCNFLAYATTAQVGRYQAGGMDDAVRQVAGQTLWLAAGLGVLFILLGWLAGPPALLLLSGQQDVAALANLYLRIAVLGLPFALLALAGQGVLRGMRDLQSPLIYIIGGNALNVVLELVFVYSFGWGLAGGAAATAIAQGAMGAGFIYKLIKIAGGVAPPNLATMRPLLRMSGQIAVRTGALRGSFVVVSAALAHLGPASLAAHQVLFQLWSFLALVLDAIAIAGQVLVSRALGAGDEQEAISAANRMIGWSAVAGAAFAIGLVALGGVLPRLFTPDEAVLERTAAAWLIFALMQPVNGAVFALDGILIGAGDSRYLMWSMLAAAGIIIPLTWVAYLLGWGIEGIWLAIFGLILVRLGFTGWRYHGRKWVLVG